MLSFGRPPVFRRRTLSPHVNLGNALRNRGDLEGAVAAYRRAAAIDSKNEASRRGLANLYILIGEPDKAEPVIREILAEERKRFGADSVNYSHPLAEWGELLVDHGRMAAAEPILRESLAIRERLTPDIWSTYYTTSYLGLALAYQGKDAEAKPLLLKGYAGLTRLGVPSAWRARLPVTFAQLPNHSPSCLRAWAGKRKQ